MWVLLFLAALVFVLGGALILLRSAKHPKFPIRLKRSLMRINRMTGDLIILFTNYSPRRHEEHEDKTRKNFVSFVSSW